MSILPTFSALRNQSSRATKRAVSNISAPTICCVYTELSPGAPAIGNYLYQHYGGLVSQNWNQTKKFAPDKVVALIWVPIYNNNLHVRNVHALTENMYGYLYSVIIVMYGCYTVLHS